MIQILKILEYLKFPHLQCLKKEAILKTQPLKKVTKNVYYFYELSSFYTKKVIFGNFFTFFLFNLTFFCKFLNILVKPRFKVIFRENSYLLKKPTKVKINFFFIKKINFKMLQIISCFIIFFPGFSVTC